MRTAERKLTTKSIHSPVEGRAALVGKALVVRVQC